MESKMVAKSVTLTKREIDWVEKYAKEHEVTFSEMLRRLLDDIIEKEQ